MKDFWGKTKVDDAIEFLHLNEPPEGYYLSFSGGKDSQIVYHLAKLAGVKFDAHYNRAMEPPELVRFIKENYPEVQRHLPNKTMWQLIREQGIPPLRNLRYCCRILKEHGGRDRIKLIGIRAEESHNRRKRKMVEKNRQTKESGLIISPILYWSLGDVWDFIKDQGLKYCSLYDEGFNRIGCVMCPMGGAGQIRREAERWPKIAEAYRRACVRAWDANIANWKDGNEMYEWWLTGKAHKETPWF